MTFDQAEFDVRCEWGPRGVELLAPISDVVIIVDVLSFTTCVEIAAARGAAVYPYRWRDYSSEQFAASIGGVLAGSRRTAKRSLSPCSLLDIEAGTKLVLPSPNGSSLSLGTGGKPTLAGCLRNAHAVARAAAAMGEKIALIPAGERWPDASLRPAIEDLLGAGAIVAALAGRRSPEAQTAVDAFKAAATATLERLSRCSSGKELTERGFARDVELAAAVDVSECVPVLRDGAYCAI